MPDRNVSGSVIQRTFVGTDLPAALFAASVPLDEIASSNKVETDADIKRLIAEVLAVPANALLDEVDYKTLVTRMGGRWSHRWMRFDPYSDDLVFEMDKREKQVMKESESGEHPIRMFAEHSVALMVTGETGRTHSWFGMPLSAELNIRNLNLETDETAFATGMACFNARVQRSPRTADFTESILEYDIPFGNSPKASSDSLLKLLDSGKKMCLAPMAAGATFGIAQLSHGLYVAAILTVGAGSAMTLILLGSVAVGSLLVQRVAQTRSGRTDGKELKE